MKRKLLYVLAFILPILGYTQNRKGAFRITGDAPHVLYVSFDARYDFDAEHLTQDAIEKIPQLAALGLEFNFTFEKAVSISDSKLEEMERNAQKLHSGTQSVKRLHNLFKVSVQNADNAKLLALAGQLENLSAVTYCSLISAKPIAPPSDIPPTTGNFQFLQSYIMDNPGVNMKYAWDAGLNGAGIRVRDVEYGFNKNHEEFTDNDAILLAPGMTISAEADEAYTEHGTAVFGIIASDKGIYGSSGLAYGISELMQFPEWQIAAYDRIFAVSESIENSTLGDVIIYEMQTFGQNDEYVPAEYENTVWDLTKAATDSGIMVIAAAGNGNQNLDAAYYQEYMERGDSGAIIVGAGSSNTAHDIMYFSTHGSRVDVQAWGQNVFTTGYGNSQQIGGDFNQRYTSTFSGTSSATPIVSSCAIVLQSHFLAQSGEYMTPQQMRTLLIETGIAQGAGAHIGPIPNMEAALAAVDVLLSTKNRGKFSFVVYPNPVGERLWIGGEFSSSASIELRNAIGQLVFRSVLPQDKSVDLSGISSGIYFVKITDGQNSSVKKIVRK